MEISTGTAEDHPTPLPVDVTHTPGVQQPGQAAAAGTEQGGVYAPVYADQVAAGEAAAAAAMTAGMSAETDRRQTHLTDILPLGASYGAEMALPDVPPNIVPASQSDLYPYQGDEPTPAA